MNEGVGLAPVSRRTSVVEHATNEIRNAILSGRLPPGAGVSIARLSAELGISPIPVREALRALESEELVQLRPNREATVAPISVQELKDIFRARRLFEVDLVVRSLRHHTKADLARLKALNAQIASADTLEERLRSHGEFHAILVSPAATEFDWRILKVLWGSTDRYLALILTVRNARAVKATHAELIAAVQAGDRGRMRAAMGHHFESGLETIGAFLADRPGEADAG